MTFYRTIFFVFTILLKCLTFLWILTHSAKTYYLYYFRYLKFLKALCYVFGSTLWSPRSWNNFWYLLHYRHLLHASLFMMLLWPDYLFLSRVKPISSGLFYFNLFSYHNCQQNLRLVLALNNKTSIKHCYCRIKFIRRNYDGK